jgi:phosphatidylserine/phosphatidylglycerophosphate/cardiolipin synthase-like enzyme
VEHIIERLAVLMTPTQAVMVASSLEIDGNVARAAALLTTDGARDALRASCDAFGEAPLAAILRGFSAVARTNSMSVRPVWSGPSFPGDEDHTTAAVSNLIDSAKEDVLASTYSASADSAFVLALWRAIARGVRTTLVVDTHIKNGETAKMLQENLNGARFLAYRPEGPFGLQHSKVVVIDSRVALITSANLSVAGAENNLEAGLLVRDTDLASRLRRRFQSLESAGHLVALQ